MVSAMKLLLSVVSDCRSQKAEAQFNALLVRSVMMYTTLVLSVGKQPGCSWKTWVHWMTNP